MTESQSTTQSPTSSIPRALTIAGSDSGGGAGIQADLKTFSALGCYGMSVLTALTAQNTRAVTGIHGVPPDFIRAQMEAVFDDIGVDAVKIGMLHSGEVIRTVARTLKSYRPPHIVVDPVMVAKSGDRLLQDEAVVALKELLIPMATIITPNLPEAGVLTGISVTTTDDMEKAGRILLDLGPAAVLVKGGHLPRTDMSPDCLLYCNDVRNPKDVSVRWFMHSRVKTNNNHGTGCTLSSAITAGLARNEPLETAVNQALCYLHSALKGSAKWKMGQGHGPVHHFHKWWE